MIKQSGTPVNYARLYPVHPPRPSSGLPWKWIALLAVVMGSLAVVGSAYRSGRVEAAEGRSSRTVKTKEVQLSSRVGGRVAVVHVQEGQLVEQGQVLITFESQELTSRRDQAQGRLAAAKAALARGVRGPLPEELAVARAAADVAQARLKRARAGAREEQKRQAQGELDAALADQRHADEDFVRAELLLGKNAISQAEYDTARAGRDRARHRISVAQAARDLTLRGSEEEIAEAKAEFERVQAQYELLRHGTREEDRTAAEAAVAQAQAQLAESEATLRETVVLAAERCVVEAVNVRPGSVVAAGQTVIVAH